MSDLTQSTKKSVSNFKKRIEPLVDYFKNCKDKTIGIGDIKQLDKHGNLINELRREYRLGKLLPEEIELLEYIGMKWGYSFADTVNILKKWCTKNKCTLKNANQYSKLEINVDGEISVIDVGGIIGRLRLAKRNGELSDPQSDILDIMEMIWEPRKAEILYAHLIAYGEENGTLADIPKNKVYSIDGDTRNIWRQADRLKKKYVEGTLTKDVVDCFAKYDLWHGLEQEVSNDLIK